MSRGREQFEKGLAQNFASSDSSSDRGKASQIPNKYSSFWQGTNETVDKKAEEDKLAKNKHEENSQQSMDRKKSRLAELGLGSYGSKKHD